MNVYSELLQARNNLNVPQVKMHKWQYSLTMEYYSTIKKNKLLIHTVTADKLQSIIVSERLKGYILCYFCEILEKNL